MRTILRLVCATVVLCTLAGCRETEIRELLVVEFKPETPLEYKFVSERDITLDLTSEDPKIKGKNKPQTMSEKLEMVILYEPVDVDPYGVTTIKGTCKSAKVTRKSFTSRSSGADAAEQLAGESFLIKLTPTGKISDYSDLTRVVQKVGKKAFATNTPDKGRIKNPDMIHDFIAMQWYVWDSVATIKKPLDGVAEGDSWAAEQLIPLPIPLKKARRTTYTFESVDDAEDGRKATMTSSFELAPEAKLETWPNAYGGRYSMRGMFGFLKGYSFKSIDGTGRQIFNIDEGIVESDIQEYRMIIDAEFLLALGDSKPHITIDQKISVELLDN